MTIKDPKASLAQMMRDAEENRLWGTIELEYRDGLVVLIRKSETHTTTEKTHVNRSQNQK